VGGVRGIRVSGLTESHQDNMLWKMLY